MLFKSDHYYLQIDVLLKSGCKQGKLEHWNLHYNIALVSVKYCARRPLSMSFDSQSIDDVVAVGRSFKYNDNIAVCPEQVGGILMAASGCLVPWSGTLDCEFLTRSTCKITKVLPSFIVITLFYIRCNLTV